jgi:hypothetical protein
MPDDLRDLVVSTIEASLYARLRAGGCCAKRGRLRPSHPAGHVCHQLTWLMTFAVRGSRIPAVLALPLGAVLGKKYRCTNNPEHPS